MWSIGVITYILLSGYPPFQDDNQNELFNKIKLGIFYYHEKYWSNVSNEAKDFINHLLVIDPHLRLTVDDALRHPWLNIDPDVLDKHILDYRKAHMEIMSQIESQHHIDIDKHIATKKLRTTVKALVALIRLKHHVEYDNRK
jgi:serine/threonine protein kinase